MGFGDLGLWISGSGIKVQGSGFRLYLWRCAKVHRPVAVGGSLESRVQGVEFRVQGVEFRVQGLGCRVQG